MPSRRPPSSPSVRVGIDTGGTFTDLVALFDDETIAFKVPSTPDAPERAVLAAMEALRARRPLPARRRLVHGSTVATNALLEHDVARVAFVTNEGFEDVIEIGRQSRRALYAVAPSRPAPLVDRAARLGIAQRTEVDGRISQTPSAEALEQLRLRLARLRPDAIAIGLLHAYAHPAPERAIADALAALGVPITCSSDVAPQFREFERFSTVVANAALLPKVDGYLGRLLDGAAEADWLIQQSNGGLTSVEDARRHPVRMVLSGPAGGVHAAERVLEGVGVSRAITFDMGGTSTDVGLVHGRAQRVESMEVDGRPLLMDAMELHTIGAGGGSLVWLDAAGALRVGPRSAGATPGPACYGQGTEPTVTDAHVLLGRIPTARRFGDAITIDASRSAAALSPIATAIGVTPRDVAHAVLDIADAAMEKAIRHVSLERGHDPREHTLFAFGGAGGLHACRLAARLGQQQVVVPPHPGATSAFGMAVGDARIDRALAWLRTLDAAGERALRPAFRTLERDARAQLVRELGRGSSHTESRVACRYVGQSYELTVPYGDEVAARFAAEHERLYGFRLERPVECVALHTSAVRPSGWSPRPVEHPRTRARTLARYPVWFGAEAIETPVIERTALPQRRLRGPALIVEETSTLVLEPEWSATVEPTGCLLLTPHRKGASRSRPS